MAGGLLGGVQEMIGSVTGGLAGPRMAKQEEEPIGFKQEVSGYQGDGFTTSTVGTTGVPKEHTKIAVISTGFVEIWALTVLAQQALRYGFGKASLPYNQGYLFFEGKSDHATAPVAIEGMLRLLQHNARRTRTFVVWEGRTELLHPAAAQQTKEGMIALPEQTRFPLVGEDSLIALELMADVAQNLGWGAELTDVGGDCTKIRIPTTIYE